MKKPFWITTLLIAATALVVTGCSAKPAAKAEDTQAAEGKLASVKSAGVLKIGTEGTYAPFTFHDASGKLVGFDVEIAEEVAKRIGVKAEFIETKWDGMFAGLDAKRFDLVANQVTIRDDRKEKYDFSVPYITSRAVLITHSDNADIKTFEDLKGKKSGQSLTSNLGDLAKSFGAELVQVDGFNQAIDLLSSKRIDATINDSLSFLDFKKQRPEAPIQVVAEAETKDQSGLLFNKGDEDLVKAVNEALEAMIADGTYKAISEKYFGTDVLN